MTARCSRSTARIRAAASDPKSHAGRHSSKVNELTGPAIDNRVYIGSHPTKDLLVIDSHDGAVIGKIDLGGTPEQTMSDGHGTLYAVLQD